MNIRKILKYLFNKDYRFTVNSLKLGMHKKMDDKTYLCRIFKGVFGYDLDLNNPKTFNEKVQWLKLYDRNPLYTKMVDKFEVKRIVSNLIGAEHVIPTLGVWNSFEEIDFNALPNQFVLKCTHDSGGIVICRDKSCFDYKKAKKKIQKSLKRAYFTLLREWPYKNVPPRIIAEKYMENSKTNDLRDYKFFCFNGAPKILFVATERQNKNVETKFDFFDMDFKHLPIVNGHPNSLTQIEKPEKFEEMIEFSKILSRGISHVRCDFYEIDGKVYFGEMTFSHYSGLVAFEPNEWDEKLGSWIDIKNNGLVED